MIGATISCEEDKIMPIDRDMPLVEGFIPTDAVKLVACPRCRREYYVDRYMSLKEPAVCRHCGNAVEMLYQEPARLCQCNDASRQDMDAGCGQHIEAVKVIVLLHYRMMNGKHRIQIDPPKALQNTGLFRKHSQHAVMYINPMPIIPRDKYEAVTVRIHESVPDDGTVPEDDTSDGEHEDVQETGVKYHRTRAGAEKYRKKGSRVYHRKGKGYYIVNPVMSGKYRKDVR